MPTDNEYLRLIWIAIKRLADEGTGGGGTIDIANLATEETLQSIGDFTSSIMLETQNLAKETTLQQIRDRLFPNLSPPINRSGFTSPVIGEWVEVAPASLFRLKWFVQNLPSNMLTVEIGFGELGGEFAAFQLEPGASSTDLYQTYRGRIVIRAIPLFVGSGASVESVPFFAHEVLVAGAI
jgi:hypothetical protein